MKTKLLSVLAVFAMTITAAVAAPVYLDNDAKGLGDGSSWANACTNFSDAWTAVKASEDKVLYVAKGWYKLPSSYTTFDGLAIYGGFSGVDGETLENRDINANMTVFSGYSEDSTWTWGAIEPTADNPYGFTDVSSTREGLADYPVFVDGVLADHPPYVGDYDTFYIKRSGGSGASVTFVFPVNQNVTFDGVYFIHTGNMDVKSSGESVACMKMFRNCTFIGCGVHEEKANSGISGTLTVTLESCRFMYGNGVRTLYMFSHTTAIKGCTLFNMYRYGGDVRIGHIDLYGYGSVSIDGCTFDRVNHCSSLGTTASSGGSYTPANLITREAVSNYSFENCVVSNCLTVSKDVCGVSLMTLDTTAITNCYFRNNRSVFRPNNGRPYQMITANAGYGTHNTAFDGCVFEGNVVAAPELGLLEGSYGMGIIGTGATKQGKMRVVNSTFASNRCEVVEADGVTPILSQGILFGEGVDATINNYGGVANSTFIAPASSADLYDIALYSKYHIQPVKVVNSVFSRDGVATYEPFYSDVDGKLSVYDCSVAGLWNEIDGIAFSGLECDEVPLERRMNEKTGIPYYQVMADMPGIRKSADVALTSSGRYTRTWRYRLRDSDSWASLMVCDGSSSAAATPIVDALGANRTFGAITRGAVQSLDSAAEAGRTLVLRVEPLGMATFSAPHWQVKGAGEAITPVTVIPVDGATFTGWYTTNNVMVSENATLEMDSITEETQIIIAKITAPKVTVTYDLGKYGTFADGKTTKVFECNVYEPFPEVEDSEIIENDDWKFEGWNETLPDTVPDGGFTVTASGVSKALRIIYLTPEGAGRVDGTSWDHAYNDLHTAYKDAARYRGEVWVKTGAYIIPVEISAKSNVRVIGGFAGTETKADQADRDANPTIFTGDASKNNYWNISAKTPIVNWDTLTINMPAPTSVTSYWTCNGNSGEDYIKGFNLDNGVVNCAFENIDFVSFKHAAVAALDGSELTMKKCRIVGCNSAYAGGTGAAGMRIYGKATLEQCDFIGMHTPLYITSTVNAQREVLLKDCNISYNYGHTQSGGGGVIVSSSHCNLTFDGCRMKNNYFWTHQGWQYAHFTAKACRNLTMRNCIVEDNGVGYRCNAVMDVGTISQALTVENCIFRNNHKTGTYSDRGNNGGAVFRIDTVGSNSMIKNCLFQTNTVSELTSASQGSWQAAAINHIKGNLTIENCTFEDNSVDSTGAPAGNHWGAIVAYGNNANGAIINCTFNNNTTVEEKNWDVLFGSGSSASTSLIMNSILWNDKDEAYAPLFITTNSAARAVSIVATAIKGYDPENFKDEALKTTPGLIEDVYTASPVFREKDVVVEGELWMRGISGSSPYIRAGRPIWKADDGLYYFYDETTNPEKPWRKVLNSTFFSATPPAGVTLKSPAVVDALGASRSLRGSSLGPVNCPKVRTVLKLQ